MTEPIDALRECPTPADGHEPLIAHQISPATCSVRQASHYHKCPSCVHGGAEGVDAVPALAPLRPESAAALGSAGPVRPTPATGARPAS